MKNKRVKLNDLFTYQRTADFHESIKKLSSIVREYIVKGIKIGGGGKG